MEIVKDKNYTFIELNDGKKFPINEYSSNEEQYLGSTYSCDSYFYDELDEYDCKEIPKGVLLTIDAYYEEYSNLEFIDLMANNDNELVLLFDIGYEINDWNEKINIMSFRELLIEYTSARFIKRDDSTDVEENRLMCALVFTVNCDGKINSIIKTVLSGISNVHKKIIRDYNSISKIIKESLVPNEYQSASISLLHYFSEVMKQKHPEIDISMSVENQKDLLKVTISCPKESKQLVNETFSQYGMVLSGKIRKDVFFTDPHHIMSLEHKLDLANVELNHTKERLILERNQYSERIIRLEDDVQRYTNLLSDMMTREDRIRQEFNKIFLRNDKLNTKNNKKIMKLLIKSMEEQDKGKFKKTIVEIQEKEPGLFDELYNVIVKGAVSGTAGNFLYQWVLPLVSVLPK